MKLNTIQEVEISQGEFKATLKTDMPWFNYSKMFAIKDNTERGIYTLMQMLVKWNLENDDGTPAEINEVNIKKLSKEIGIFLSEKCQELLLQNIEKKKSSSEK